MRNGAAGGEATPQGKTFTAPVSSFLGFLPDEQVIQAISPCPYPYPYPYPYTPNVCAQQAIAALHRDDHEGAARALSAARAGALALLGTELLEQPSLRQQGR